ncbi:MAG: hypothetical protein IID46_08820 [Planctomycetes bacterium]|nr:hypothetical protein [Planctomycetota bacterium]
MSEEESAPLTSRLMMAFGLCVVCNQTALAATFTVDVIDDTPDDDPGDGVAEDEFGNTSLRAAVEEANTTTARDTINFSLGAGDDCIEVLEQIQITEDLTINGPGATSLLVNGGLENRVFLIDDNTDVDISDLTLYGEEDLGSGGCIYNYGTLDLNDCVLGGFADFGGAIYNDGTGTNDGQLTLTNSTIENCLAQLGGGILTDDGDVTLDGSTIKNCDVDFNGGGITIIYGTVLLKNESVITLNFATATGGGIILECGTLTVDNSSVCDNCSTEDWDGPDLYCVCGTYSIINGGEICDIDGCDD